MSQTIDRSRCCTPPQSTRSNPSGASISSIHNAVRLTRTLGTRVGMQRIGVHIVRLQPGRESTQFHYHDADEEFLYVLEGRGIAEIGDESYEVGPGDFMGFTTPSPAHAVESVRSRPRLSDGGRAQSERRRALSADSPLDDQGPGRRRWVDWDDLHEL